MIENKIGKKIKVLIGQVSLTKAPNVLQTVLGSCIGVTMYDPIVGIGGMTHVLLPDSIGRVQSELPGKYADLAIPCLYDAIVKLGGKPSCIKAKIAGGARMFEASVDYSQNDVGSSNITAVKKALKKVGVPIIAEDTGGTAGRKIEFELIDYTVLVEDFTENKQII